MPIPSARSAVAALLRRADRALLVDGDLRASREGYDAAFRAADAATGHRRSGGTPDPAALAAAALGLGGMWVHEHRAAAADLLVRGRQRRALELLDPASPLALRLRGRLAAEADYRTGGRAGILAVLEDARRSGDPIAWVEALSLAHHCLLGPDHAELRRALADELISAATETGRRCDLLTGLLWRTVDQFFEADPHAERTLAELRAHLAEQDHLAIGYVAQAMDVMLAIRAGRFDQAEALAAVVAQRGAAAGDADATGWYGAQLVAIRWYQGRLGELADRLHELSRSPTLSPVDNSYDAALAVAAASAGQTREAAGTLASLAVRDLPRSSSWLVAMYGLVEAAGLLGDAASAARAYAELLPYGRLPMIASLGAACFGSVEHALGVAALTTGELDQAIGHLQAAVRQNLALAHWPATVLSRWRLAEALAAQHGAGHGVAAAEREAATREAGELGMALPRPGTPAAVPASRRSGRAVDCVRCGRSWQITFAGHRALVPHSIGMLRLAVLLANPGQEIAAVDLAASAPVPLPVDAGARSHQPVLDAAARQGYRARLAQLRTELDRDCPDRSASAARASRREELCRERDWLISELTAAEGLGGRQRSFVDNTERARVAVGKSIRRAVNRVAQADPVLGEELVGTVQTGLNCSYRPR